MSLSLTCKWWIVLLAAIAAPVLEGGASTVATGTVPSKINDTIATVDPIVDPITIDPCNPKPTPKPDISDWDGEVIDSEWWEYIRKGLGRGKDVPSELRSSFSDAKSVCVAPENIPNEYCSYRCAEDHPNVRNSVCLENNYQSYTVWAFCPSNPKICKNSPWTCIKKITIRLPQCCECWSCWDMMRTMPDWKEEGAP